jgi:hypothetical protein
LASQSPEPGEDFNEKGKFTHFILKNISLLTSVIITEQKKRKQHLKI